MGNVVLRCLPLIIYIMNYDMHWAVGKGSTSVPYSFDSAVGVCCHACARIHSPESDFIDF